MSLECYLLDVNLIANQFCKYLSSCKVDDRDRDRHLNIINKTTLALSDENLESGNLFHTDTLRVMA